MITKAAKQAIDQSVDVPMRYGRSKNNGIYRKKTAYKTDNVMIESERYAQIFILYNFFVKCVKIFYLDLQKSWQYDIV